jgi:hypothetical protein
MDSVGESTTPSRSSLCDHRLLGLRDESPREEQAGGYPERAATKALFKAEEWDLATMQRKQ